MNHLITECINNLQPVYLSHRIVFREEYSSHYSDRERIRQVIVNLITNAIKYSPMANEIVISTEAVENGVETKVTDYGISIPANIRTKIFERFFRVHQESALNFTGWGLGLYIAAGIIKEHKGIISVDCNESEGTIFRFVLPYKSTGDEINTSWQKMMLALVTQ